MAYLLDSNVFIEAKNRHYGFDFCPGFWDRVDRAHAAGTVFSVDSVKIELLSGNDDLTTWAQQRPRAFFVLPDAATVPSLRATSTWATGAGYEPAAVTTFLQNADYYLVGQAHAGQHVVVTHEVVSSSPKRIKIPDACLALGVRYANPFQMLRQEHARFVIAP
jgi:hypothetical protein